MFDQIHDCFISVYRRGPNRAELRMIAKSLPAEIKFLADQWGWNNTGSRGQGFLLDRTNESRKGEPKYEDRKRIC